MIYAPVIFASAAAAFSGSASLAHAPSRPIVASHPAAPMLTMSLERSSRGALLSGLAAGLALNANAQKALADTPRSSPWSFSTFLDAIDQDLVEKVSFSPDGKQVLVIDRDGNRHEALILNGESTEPVSYTHLTLPTKA